MDQKIEFKINVKTKLGQILGSTWTLNYYILKVYIHIYQIYFLKAESKK